MDTTANLNDVAIATALVSGFAVWDDTPDGPAYWLDFLMSLELELDAGPQPIYFEGGWPTTADGLAALRAMGHNEKADKIEAWLDTHPRSVR